MGFTDAIILLLFCKFLTFDIFRESPRFRIPHHIYIIIIHYIIGLTQPGPLRVETRYEGGGGGIRNPYPLPQKHKIKRKIYPRY